MNRISVNGCHRAGAHTGGHPGCPNDPAPWTIWLFAPTPRPAICTGSKKPRLITKRCMPAPLAYRVVPVSVLKRKGMSRQGWSPAFRRQAPAHRPPDQCHRDALSPLGDDGRILLLLLYSFGSLFFTFEPNQLAVCVLCRCLANWQLLTGPSVNEVRGSSRVYVDWQAQDTGAISKTSVPESMSPMQIVPPGHSLPAVKSSDLYSAKRLLALVFKKSRKSAARKIGAGNAWPVTPGDRSGP